MWTPEWPPFALFFLGALLVPLTRGRLRGALLIAIPIIGALNLWQMPAGVYWQFEFLNFELVLFRADKLSTLFGYIFHIAALLAFIYSLHERDTLQYTAGMLYIGSALGAVFAGDLLTLFVFWELLAVSSVFLIWARKSWRAYVAGLRYFTFHILSGLLLLAGIVIHSRMVGSFEFTYIGLQQPYTWLIFLAFGIKSAFPFVHNWLTDAYPESTPVGTVFLSAFTTKVAIYALARSFPGTELLVYIGAAMTCFPIFFAVIENDLRRVLAYSLINQLGFMVVGIGIGTALAINGAVAHAFNDVIFKGLLFMAMGAVLHMTGRVNGSELGGLYKTMPKTTALCIVGAASISAFPLFSGFVSKSMVMSAALDSGYDGIWLVLLFASAGVFHHAGIKIPYFAFFAHDSGIRAGEPPGNMLTAMFIAATLCVLVGVFPQALYRLLPYDTVYSPYDTTHVLTQLQLLFFSALAFVWLNLMRLYPPELASVNLDVEWLYRRVLPRLSQRCLNLIWRLDAGLRRSLQRGWQKASERIATLQQSPGILGQGGSTGGTVTWVTVLLAAYLFLSFI